MLRPLLLTTLALASCAGPGFRLEGTYEDIRPNSVRFYPSVPPEVQDLGSVRARRGGVRIAIGGPEFSARGYLRLFAEELEVPTSASGGTFDDVGVGVGVLGRQQLTPGEVSEPVVILPYRFGLNYVRGTGQGTATPTGTFGEIEYLQWEADLGIGVSMHTFDVIAGYALRVLDGKVQVRDASGVFRDGLRGTNLGPYLSAAYAFAESPWRLEFRVGFQDVEELSLLGGLYY